jgi:hypothetical protein
MNKDLFSGTRTPRPPADLKDRALRAARAAARKPFARRRPAWGFNRLDLAWVAALLVLLLCHVLLSVSGPPSPAQSPRVRIIAAADELGRELGLKGQFVLNEREARRDDLERRQLTRALEHL